MQADCLKNRTAFLSGSYRGLGFAMARALGDRGARVILNGRDAAALAAAVQVLRDRGLDAAGYPFDVTSRSEADPAVRRMLDEQGPVDILVNNAGMHRRGPLESLSPTHWDEVIGLNLTAAFTLAQGFVKGMIGRKRGKIINVCSLMSSLARPTTGAYAASKGGLLMLTRAMAAEWARHNIQANAIAPGYFATELTEPLRRDPAFNQWITSRTPAGRWGEPEELGGLAVFLAGDGSAFINGQCIYVDGGLSAVI